MIMAKKKEEQTPAAPVASEATDTPAAVTDGPIVSKEEVARSLAAEREDIEVLEAVTEGKELPSVERIRDRAAPKAFDKNAWVPKTALGRAVKAGEIKNISQILGSGTRIMEAEIVDCLLPNLEYDLLMIGQAKGKFGGGQRRAFKQVQKKTSEGNKPKFATLAVVGNKDGFVGLGYGKAKETVPSREKALRNAKLNLIQIRRGSGSWEDQSPEPNTVPFKVYGKSGSVMINLMPAPGGTGLSIEKECGKVLRLAGIKDIWSKSSGHKNTKMNMLKACFNALKQLSTVKVPHKYAEEFNIVSGSIAKTETSTE